MLVKYSKRPKFLKCDVMAMNRVEPQHIHIPISSSNLRLSIVNDLGKIEGNPGLPSTSAMESPGAIINVQVTEMWKLSRDFVICVPHGSNLFLKLIVERYLTSKTFQSRLALCHFGVAERI